MVNQSGYTIAAFFADTHPNSKVGLCPPGEVVLEGGGYYTPSDAQVGFLWVSWLHFWRRVTTLRKHYRAQVYAVSVGDGCEDNSHSQHGLISLNKAIIVAIGASIWEPIDGVANRKFVVRGTEAHVGRTAELEELMAQRIEAVRCPLSGRASKFRWFIKVGGVVFDVRHRSESYSMRPWTRGAGAIRSAGILQDEYDRIKRAQPEWEAPTIAVRAHRHRHEDSAANNEAVRVVFCPGWQMMTAFAHVTGKAIEPVGGWIFVAQGGRVVYDELRTYYPKVEGPWQSEK